MKYLYPELMILVGYQNWFDDYSKDEMIQYWYIDKYTINIDELNLDAQKQYSPGSF